MWEGGVILPHPLPPQNVPLKCQPRLGLNLGPKMPDLCIFGLGFENIFVMFEISILEFFLLQSLVQK